MNDQIDINYVIEGYKQEVAELTNAKVLLQARLRQALEEIEALKRDGADSK